MKRPLTRVVETIGRLSERWLRPDFAFRKQAVTRLTRGSGFSEEMAGAILDSVFSELTTPRLWALLRAELKDPRVLEGFRKDGPARRSVRAHAPESVLHIFASNVPQASITSFVLGMLLQSRNIGKLSSRDDGFLGVYLESLKRMDAGLYAMNTLLPPQDKKGLMSCLNKASLVVAYGSDETLNELRRRTPASTRFIAYGHRLSAGLYMKQAMARRSAARMAREAATDIWMADQRGCLSPVTFYVEAGGETSPVEWSSMVAKELQKRHEKEVSGPRRGLSSSASVYQAQSRHLVQKVRRHRSAFWQSTPAGIWAVAYEEDMAPSLQGGSQVISVKGFEKLGDVEAALRPLKRYLQCVSLECNVRDRLKIAESLSELGVNRICRAGQMQLPPVTWHHDGRPNLSDWLYWTDLE